MSRHAQWDARLVALVAKHRDSPYAWGTHDCMTFAADVAKAVTGKDHAKGHRGKYKSHASAMVYLQRLGADTPEDYLDLLFDEKPVGFAGRGDLVMAADGIPMVCMGSFALSVGSEGNREGLVQVPRAEWVKAWAIGEHFSSWPQASDDGRPK
jgi:hypothetical protein